MRPFMTLTGSSHTYNNQYLQGSAYYTFNVGHTNTLTDFTDTNQALGIWGSGIYQVYKYNAGSTVSGILSSITTQLLVNDSGTIDHYAGIRIFYPNVINNGSWSGQVTNYYGLRIESTTGPRNSIGTTITNKWGIYQSGSADNNYFAANVSIGTTSTTYKLNVNGDSQITNGSLGVGVTPNATDGRISALDDIIAFASDNRLKTEITKIDNAIEKIDKISGVKFKWNQLAKQLAGYNTDETYIGVIAQELQEVLPEVVKIAPFDNNGKDESISGEKYLTVQYEKIVPLLIEAIKELNKKIEELNKK